MVSGGLKKKITLWYLLVRTFEVFDSTLGVLSHDAQGHWEESGSQRFREKKNLPVPNFYISLSIKVTKL